VSRSARATGLTRVLAVEAGLEYSFHRPSGGRTWWAQFEFTRINIKLPIVPKKFEDFRQLGAFMVRRGGNAWFVNTSAFSVTDPPQPVQVARDHNA
jgi:hypothetical protein